MEYWLNKEGTIEEINQILDCQLYSAVTGKHTHFTEPKNIVTIQADTIFEGVEALSALNDGRKYIVSFIDGEGKTFIDLIKHVIKNKELLPNIQLFSVLDTNSVSEVIRHFQNISNMQQALTVMSYGIDYLVIKSKIGPKTGKWIADFRDKGLYKTRIIVDHAIHIEAMVNHLDIFYDGIEWQKDMISY